MSPTLPLGGPHINRSKIFFESWGACANSLNFNFTIDAGPRPAGSAPSTSRSWVGTLNPSSDG